MNNNDKLVTIVLGIVIVFSVIGLMAIALEITENPVGVAISSIAALVAFLLIYYIPEDS